MGLFNRYTEKREERLQKQVDALETRNNIETLEMKLLEYNRNHELYLRKISDLKEDRKLRKVGRAAKRANVKAEKAKALGALENARTTIYSARADRKKRKLENKRFKRETYKMREVKKDRDPAPTYIRYGGNWHSSRLGGSSSYKK